MKRKQAKHFVLFACNQIGTDVLRLLSKHSGCILDHVFTYELPLDLTYNYEPVTAAAERLKVPYSKNKSSDWIRAELRNHKPDYILSVYYRKILPQDVFSKGRLGAFNIHPSLLPAYRGPTPTGWALLNGEDEVGVTIHAIDAGIDTGPVLAQSRVPITSDDTGYTLHDKAMREGFRLFRRVLPRLLNEDIKLTPQKGRGSYYGSIGSIDKRIRWHEEASILDRKIRCLSRPYGGMFTHIHNKTLMVYGARVLALSRPLQGPGRLIEVRGKNLVISCADGYLELTDYEFVPGMTEPEKAIYFAVGSRFQ